MSTGTRILTGHETSLYIDGSWSAPSDGRLVDVINPTTEEAIGQAAMAGPADIDRAVRAARAGLRPRSVGGRDSVRARRGDDARG